MPAGMKRIKSNKINSSHHVDCSLCSWTLMIVTKQKLTQRFNFLDLELVHLGCQIGNWPEPNVLVFCQLVVCKAQTESFFCSNTSSDLS